MRGCESASRAAHPTDVQRRCAQGHRAAQDPGIELAGVDVDCCADCLPVQLKTKLSPDERLNHDLKWGLAKGCPRNRVEQISAVRSRRHKRHKRQKQTHVVKKFFKAKHVQYAA